jgi:hypothetical protein
MTSYKNLGSLKLWRPKQLLQKPNQSKVRPVHHQHANQTNAGPINVSRIKPNLMFSPVNVSQTCLSPIKPSPIISVNPISVSQMNVSLTK